MNIEAMLAEMTPELKKRLATGVAGGALFLLILIFGGWIGITVLTAALVIGMLWEFSKLIYEMPDQIEKKYGLLLLGWLIVVVDMVSPRVDFELLLFCFYGMFFYFLATAARYHQPELKTHFKEFMSSMFAILYVGMLPIFLPRLHEYANGVYWSVLFFLIVWSNDTGAYFVGKKYGKRKLYAHISPKKTVEGSLGGLATGWVVAILFKLLFFKAASWSGIVLIPLLVGPFTQVGDLAESFLKRAFEIKDSGTLLPGHGGVMDRFDGAIYALPIMYAVVRLFG